MARTIEDLPDTLPVSLGLPEPVRLTICIIHDTDGEWTVRLPAPGKATLDFFRSDDTDDCVGTGQTFELALTIARNNYHAAAETIAVHGSFNPPELASLQ